MDRLLNAARVDRNGLEVLDRAACLDLLATAPLGRLAYLSRTVPRVIPLNLMLDGDRLLFRLGTGGALAAVESGQLVTLEADEFDHESGSGWSVSVVGIASEIPAALAAEPGRRLRSWLRGTTGRVFRLRTDEIEGRRLLPPLVGEDPARLLGPLGRDRDSRSTEPAAIEVLTNPASGDYSGP